MVLEQKKKYRSMEQDRKPRDKPMHYGHLIYDKGGKTIQWRKDILFNKWCWEDWTATLKRWKLKHSFTPYTKINSKWIKDLNVRPDTLKLLEENIGRTLFDINHSNIFLIHLLKQLEIKTKINKWDQGFPDGAVVKNPPANAGDTGLSPCPGRSHMLWSN